MSPTYQKQWRYRDSIIRQRGAAYQVETNANGKRRRVTKRTKAAAEAYAKEMQDQIAADGSAALELSGKNRLEAVEALRMFSTAEMRQAAKDALEVLPYPEQRLDAAHALAILRGEVDDRRLRKKIPTPLAEAARFWLRHHPEGLTPPTVQKALQAYEDLLA